MHDRWLDTHAARSGVFRRHPPGETSAFAVRHYTDLEEAQRELEAQRDCEGEVIGTRGLSRARASDSSLTDHRQAYRDLGELWHGLDGPDFLGFAGMAVGPPRCLVAGPILVALRSLVAVRSLVGTILVARRHR